MNRIIRFLKYHNAVPFTLVLIFLGVGMAFASSPELRQSVISGGQSPTPALPVKKTDTSKLIAKDLKEYDLHLRIDSLRETANAYFVAYSYQTLEVVSGSWQEVRKNAQMDIPKAMLGTRSLETYITDQAEQVIGREIAYLSEAQAGIRASSGAKSVSGDVSSLVGKSIQKGDAKDALSENTKSVDTMRNPKAVDISGEEEAIPSATIPAEVYSKEEVRKMIVEAVAEFLAVDMSMPDDLSVPVEAVPQVPPIESIPPDTDTPLVQDPLTEEDDASAAVE